MAKQQSFDSIRIDDPTLPEWVRENAITSGEYPYDMRMKRKKYEKQLTLLQIELLKLQNWLQTTGTRAVVIFEGRDAAGKGGTILRVMQHLNPRHARTIALTKPTDAEQGQWYFQRYIQHLPTAGDMSVFDRSWYNRAGVEPVMGFCTEEQTTTFLAEVPRFEKLLVDDGIVLIKFWLNVGREMQLRRFHDRRHDPLKQWKLSEVDIKGMSLWDAYGDARDRMFKATHTEAAPWTVVKSNDKMRTRLNVIRAILNRFDYGGGMHEVDGSIVGGPDLVLGQ